MTEASGRRNFLMGGSTALLGLAACAAGSGAKDAVTTPSGSAIAVGTLVADAGAGPLSLVIDYQGQSHRFDETGGIDLGDYVDPMNQFVQGCVRARNSGIPALSVYFRRDRSSERAEVVCEFGMVFPKVTPANLEGYRATIIRGGKTLYVVEVPRHFWFSRWRWQSAVRPVRSSVAELIESGLLPNYDAAARGPMRATPARAYQIMGLAGIVAYMPTTGERSDIGPVTEYQGEYICTGRRGALASLLAQAEGAGTLPWHFRDENTGAPLDTVRYAKATVYSRNTGDPFIPMAKGVDISLDSPHQPALAYLPFLLTGDPYHLETLQFQVVYNNLESPPSYRYRMQQVRGHAWMLRSLSQAARVTPDQTPRWLLPRSHFRELLNGQRDWLLRAFVAGTEPSRAVFRTTVQTLGTLPGGRGMYIAPWEDEFQAFIFGWIVRMGFSDWEPVIRWKIGSTIARTDGKSGWMRARPTPYRMALRETLETPWAATWGECWALNAALQPQLTVADPDRLAPGDITYPSYSRGALAISLTLGVRDAEPSFAWLDREIAAKLRGQVRLDYKWCVVP